MAKVIDLSKYKKEDLEIISLEGNTYTIPGNIPSEFYCDLFESRKKIEKIKNNNFPEYLILMKELCLKIISLDKNSEVDMSTIDEEFNDLDILEILITDVMSFLNENKK